jgi:UDP-2,4-diacetamido-2,4,6-trideoxy-beta-L-altropyranose hydrolase
VTRCLALADALTTRGWRCVFAVSAETAPTVPHLKRVQHGVHVLPAGREADSTALWSSIDEGCSLLVIDDYRLGARYEASCRPVASRILVIDDLANRPHDCDILLDQNLGRSCRDYEALVPCSALVLVGASFALLRPEFAAARPAALSRRRPGIPVQRILISLGLTDLGGITARVVRAALDARTGATLDVVVSDRAESLPYLRSLESASHDIVLHVNPSNMSQLMINADLAIGAAGATSWERCCLGLPTILITLADNQRFVARSLAEAGAVKLLENTDGFEPALTNTLRDLWQSEGMRLSLARAAARTVDGKGTERVADAITLRTTTVQSGAGELRLRCADEADSKLIWNWRNDPVSRSNFRNQNLISWEAHKEWFRSALDDPSRILFCGEIDGIPIGIVRFEPIGELEYEVSINLAPERRGMGLGHRLLAVACEKIERESGEVSFRAAIRRGNIASQRIFQQCGFSEEPTDEVFVAYKRKARTGAQNSVA